MQPPRTFPRSTAVPPTTISVVGSQARSLSQSSDARRRTSCVLQTAVPLTARQPHSQSFQKLQERNARSPGPQISCPRRVPSFTTLLHTSSSASTTASNMSPASFAGVSGSRAVPQLASHLAGNNQLDIEDAQNGNLRNSLMQHIQSVQREISRLQQERQKQQCSQEAAPPPAAGAAAPISSVAVAFGGVKPISSPPLSKRHFSVERERPATLITTAATSARDLSGRPSGGSVVLPVGRSADTSGDRSDRCRKISRKDIQAVAPSSGASLAATRGPVAPGQSAPVFATAARALVRQEQKVGVVTSDQEKDRPLRLNSGAFPAMGSQQRQPSALLPVGCACDPSTSDDYLVATPPQNIQDGSPALSPAEMAPLSSFLSAGLAAAGETRAAATVDFRSGAARRIQRFWRQRAAKRRTQASRRSTGRPSRGSTAPRQVNRQAPGRRNCSNLDTTTQQPSSPSWSSPQQATRGGDRSKSPAESESAGIVSPLIANGRIEKADPSKRQATSNRIAFLTQRRYSGPVHFASTRIQRAWKLHRWRRSFLSYSRHQVQWVGSLEWLQRHNLLYGTELASGDDVSWWLQQRALAPLDREVDPWGSERLFEHLSRMWYGVTEVDKSQYQKDQELLQQQQQQQQLQLQQLHSDGAELRSRSLQERRSEDSAGAFAGAALQHSSMRAAGSGLSRSLSSGGHSLGDLRGSTSNLSQSLSNSARHSVAGMGLSGAGIISTGLGQPVRTVKAGVAGVSGIVASSGVANSLGVARRPGVQQQRQGTSLSPRYEVNSCSGMRSRGTLGGAPPPSSIQGYQKQVVPSQQLSPQQTNRTPRATLPSQGIGFFPIRQSSPDRGTRSAVGAPTGKVLPSSMTALPGPGSARSMNLAAPSSIVGYNMPPMRLSSQGTAVPANVAPLLGQVQRLSSGATHRITGSPPPSPKAAMAVASMMAHNGFPAQRR